MWSTTVPLNPKVQKLWSYFYTSCDFAHVGGEHYFGQKSTYNIYPNKSPPTLLIFSPIGSLMPNFRQFWWANFEISEKNTTFWVWGPHTTHAGKRVPPRPATTKDSTRYARNHGRGHLANRGALWRYLAYVVEGHASACPRTVGVGNCVWCCLILPSYVYFNLKWYSCVWHLWTSFRSLRWTKASFNILTL